jgi:hypothetical protein
MRKNRFLSLFFTLGLLLAFSSCSYTAEFPLSAPTEAIDEALLGKWTQAQGFENPSYYFITSNPDLTYTFQENNYDFEEKRYLATPYQVHTTTIDGVRFLNFKKGEKYYTFYKVELSADKKQMVLSEVTGNIEEQFENPDDMYAFFKKHKDLSFFYNKDKQTYNKEALNEM